MDDTSTSTPDPTADATPGSDAPSKRPRTTRQARGARAPDATGRAPRAPDDTPSPDAEPALARTGATDRGAGRPAGADEAGASSAGDGGAEAPRPRRGQAARDPRAVVTVPAGRARLVAEVATRPEGRPQEELVVQALEAEDGEPLLRVGYRRDGRMVRGPMTATAPDLGALVSALRGDALLPERFWVAAGLARVDGGAGPEPSA